MNAKTLPEQKADFDELMRQIEASRRNQEWAFLAQLLQRASDLAKCIAVAVHVIS